jgi:hypothetical protein
MTLLQITKRGMIVDELIKSFDVKPHKTGLIFSMVTFEVGEHLSLVGFSGRGPLNFRCKSW